ncbi:MAG: 3-deoxy-7-phosphoheptulonate synthase [Actinobacteria bacterium]|nr:3-deoxy-7-phosphoheptulonate synthase [Actinomycetota bacterium]
MMIIMKKGATDADIGHVVEKLHGVGAEAHISRGEFKTVIGAIGDREVISQLPFDAMPGVEGVVSIMKPYKFVSREFKDEDTIINVGGIKIGEGYFTVMAGPCSVESEEQVLTTARMVKEAGAAILRGGAFKPRTSPYAFQGLGRQGLEILAAAREETGLPIVTEVVDVRDVELVAEYADILQIGARNMQNFLLLTEVGRTDKPVLLKRGFSATIEEALMAAEYIVKAGDSKIILCERGIRTFETYTRNTLDISSVPLIKQLSHLPVIVDPSHASGKRDLIAPLTMAGLAAGADGAIIEVHPNPEEASCDGQQSLAFEQFDSLMGKLKKVAPAFDKSLATGEYNGVR